MTGLGGMHISTRTPTAARTLLGSLLLNFGAFVCEKKKKSPKSFLDSFFFGNIMGYPAPQDSLQFHATTNY